MPIVYRSVARVFGHYALAELARTEPIEILASGSFGLTFPNEWAVLSASFLDYVMPRAGLLPAIRELEHATPTLGGPLGAKGTGESGCTASLPALVEAVMDALRPFGVAPLHMPLTPLKVWTALNAARRSKPRGSAGV